VLNKFKLWGCPTRYISVLKGQYCHLIESTESKGMSQIW
jgi:hypothetical protein